MKGDFSRLTFRPSQHYARVLQQQGKPLLDADWNEQVAILLHRVQGLTRDLTGGIGSWSGAPIGSAGFEIAALPGEADNFSIGGGRYYVDGLCCECSRDTSFVGQPLPVAGKPDRDGICLVYLAAWEAVVTPADDHSLLEPALSGLQTTLRTQVVWQVRTHRLGAHHDPNAPDLEALHDECRKLHEGWRDRGRGMLRVRLGGFTQSAQPRQAGQAGQGQNQNRRGEVAAVDGGRFRGPENLLYRIEVHKGGPAGEATFKWSRENGARLIPLDSLDGTSAKAAPGAKADAAMLAPGGWVEVLGKTDRILGQSRAMVVVESVKGSSGEILFKTAPESVAGMRAEGSHGLALRPWDQQTNPQVKGEQAGPNGLAIIEGEHEAHWLDIEDGIQIQFQAASDPSHDYRAGDYWLIPARTADEGSLLGGTAARPPDGVEHYFAPLGLFVPRLAAVIADFRPSFQPLAALQDQVNSISDRLDDLESQIAAIRGP